MLHNALNNRYFKRFGSIIMALTVTFAINGAISYAGGDTGRATSTLAIPKETPQPKATSALAIPKETPQPKATSTLAIPKETPRP